MEAKQRQNGAQGHPETTLPARGAPKCPQAALRAAHVRPGWAQRSPTDSPRGPKEGLRGPQGTSKEPKRVQKGAKMDPKWCPEGNNSENVNMQKT